MSNLILYGPPASGKTTLGQLLAQRLERELVDVDAWIVQRWQRPIPDYFERGEEALFRAREAEACQHLAHQDHLVIAPGGGALLNPHSRAALESTGHIIALTATKETLLQRLAGNAERPLLRGDAGGDAEVRLTNLLKEREALYRSFPVQIVTDGLSPDAVLERVLAHWRTDPLTTFNLGVSVAVMGAGLLPRLPALLAEKQLRPPFLILSDSNVAVHHGETLSQALSAPLETFPAGEHSKNLDTVRDLYAACLKADMERGGTIVALGGGVTGDMVGFVAATFMRGVRWVNVPTSVLAMADASLGGKVGVDLPEGKNLIGAFHPPELIIADFDTLTTLPEAELRNGLAEVLKAAVIGDADLFARYFEQPYAPEYLPTLLRRGAAVKVGIVNADPFEYGERAKLNLGHTIGHGIEAASGFALKHGEAIGIGMVAATHLAEKMGVAASGLTAQITEALCLLGLPVNCPGLSIEAIRRVMSTDKKKVGKRLKFVLPEALGRVRYGVEVDETLLTETLGVICAL